MKKSIWTIALSLILFLTACGPKIIEPAAGSYMPGILQYRVHLEGCPDARWYVAVNWQPAKGNNIGPQITVYTDNVPSVVEGNKSGALAISLSNYYYTDTFQDAQDENPVVHGPFGNINVVMTADVQCVIVWSQGQYPVRIVNK